MAYSYLMRPKTRLKSKTDQKNNQIVGQMWLGILPGLPLFYLTCPVGPTLVEKGGDSRYGAITIACLQTKKINFKYYFYAKL